MSGPQGTRDKENTPRDQNLGLSAGSAMNLEIAMVLSWLCCFCPAEFDRCWGTVTAMHFIFLPPKTVFLIIIVIIIIIIAVTLLPSLPFYIWCNGGNNLSFSLTAATSDPDREESTQILGFE